MRTHSLSLSLHLFSHIRCFLCMYVCVCPCLCVFFPARFFFVHRHVDFQWRRRHVLSCIHLTRHTLLSMCPVSVSPFKVEGPVAVSHSSVTLSVTCGFFLPSCCSQSEQSALSPCVTEPLSCRCQIQNEAVMRLPVCLFCKQVNVTRCPGPRV